MNEFARLSINCKAALVVCVLDDYTSKPVSGGYTKVSLDGIRQNPMNKNGHYVFTNIDNGVYTMRISSKHYFDVITEVDIGKSYNHAPVIYIRLKPMPSYTFDAGAGLLRLKLQDKQGGQLAGAQVEAVIITKDNYRAKLVHKQAKAGDDRISLICAGGWLTHGEVLFVQDEDRSEYCTIDSCEDYEGGVIKLRQPLTHEHRQGTLLMPAVRTATDERGEAVVYFKYFAVKAFEVQLKLTHKSKSASRNAPVEEGKSLYLGQIKL
ncbi:MAG TPA: hypothetical protein VN580_04440 [Clostridia bacterium]|nr:hypothetical protein [Clostridia bacterium]